MIRFSALHRMDVLKEINAPEPERFVLIGDVVTMDEGLTVHRRGAIGIAGGAIAFVASSADCIPEPGAEWPRVETKGTIFPGLIDLHNHLPYNMLPFWSVNRAYNIRGEWQNHMPDYALNVLRPHQILSRHPDKDYPRAMARYAECRSLLGGVTTGQGVAAKLAIGDPVAYAGLVRNIEFPDDPSWPAATGRTHDFAGTDEVKTVLVPELAKNKPYLYHLSEGRSAYARRHFLNLKISDSEWAINRWLIGVHCVGLEAEDLDVFKAAAGIVWSPTSNLLLYGDTAKFDDIKQRGIPLSLGVDWSPSGCKNILGELKVALKISQHHGNVFSHADLVAMCTSNPATMIAWDDKVGRIKEGLRADLLVIDGVHEDPYLALIQARENDIDSVLVDGIVRLAKATPSVAAQPGSTELCKVGGLPYYIDVPSQQGIWQGMTLSTAIAKLSYGLENLAEIESSAKAQHTLWRATDGADANDWWIEDEMQPTPPSQVFALTPPGSPPVTPIPLKLPPLTAVDDPEFASKFAANPNLPSYLRDIFNN